MVLSYNIIKLIKNRHTLSPNHNGPRDVTHKDFNGFTMNGADRQNTSDGLSEFPSLSGLTEA